MNESSRTACHSTGACHVPSFSVGNGAVERGEPPSMRAKYSSILPLGLLWALGCFGAFAGEARGEGSTAPLESGTARVIEIEGTVEVQRAGAKPWDPSRTNQVLYPGDQLRTAQRSRTALLLSDLTVLRLGELSHIQIPETKKRNGLNFFKAFSISFIGTNRVNSNSALRRYQPWCGAQNLISRSLKTNRQRSCCSTARWM